MLRHATLDDIPALLAIEQQCFRTDRLSRRSFRHLLTHGNAAILLDDQERQIRGYVLLLFSRGTSMARLYSIAVHPDHGRRGIGDRLLEAAEAAALERDCVSMRLEVRRDNPASLALFRRHGYRQFEETPDYYEDHMDALRFEKRLVPYLQVDLVKVPYYQQTLDFTCGPAALMMAMKALDPVMELNRKLELRLWREATTIFMTSGHGGCGPYGLALSAYRRGFELEIHVNENNVFLIDSVRSLEKKEVMRLVQEDWIEELSQLPVLLRCGSLGVDELRQKCEAGGVPLVLISSWRIYGERFPHWVVVTGFDDHYIYVHDPLVDSEEGETVTDSINMPIPHREFQRMARYGKASQKAVLVLYRANRRPEPPVPPTIIIG
ncbi:MAG: GNAT family N-acetyltransferase/peptidase C39 family protein [Candidatus Competibacteraceae bacterium]|nr:GNAT family N-acetyltransferase/peptidase C39 family protein [Candidatus Competibacteraceae bacterium]MBK7983497.1 GNAT family N-acetyltransferase/peptidase C39 family protein [Candidatus Competibacteraceae bacterium]MBK8897963.1 GNAT family N-acetyltransferase/peptidase C39 family protein [Candidatus Competibacteraceae bacterium]MBK8961766.1 GNAT family N-acetyltransferase/peptidase C39 family protein [Candidatus Competibacteraceae bacterium]MBK9950982.1 GNAT family N-acetyltransferase/pept